MVAELLAVVAVALVALVQLEQRQLLGRHNLRITEIMVGRMEELVALERRMITKLVLIFITQAAVVEELGNS
tara:strand:+ start:162 stop:377 length:216 start_codon:yes stop_codon:yes gene_type:complete